MRLPDNRTLPFAALIILTVSASLASAKETRAAVAPVTGPAADYPLVVGEPFTVDGTVWTPLDQMNYDAVGEASIGAGTGITGAHKTLPLPSYVEVTSLDTGRTILLRLERRGPMTNDALIELSPEAAAQLGARAAGKAPVRVRRVNPPEQERALLRSGLRAPERMETPEGLLKVLRRKLADQAPLLPLNSAPQAGPQSKSTEVSAPVRQSSPREVTKPTSGGERRASLLPTENAKSSGGEPPTSSSVVVSPITATKKQSASAPVGKTTDKVALVVQVASFSSEESARKVAAQLGAKASRSGKFWRVQLGAFSNRVQAASALEKAKRAGYSDARIQSAE